MVVMSVLVILVLLIVLAVAQSVIMPDHCYIALGWLMSIVLLLAEVVFAGSLHMECWL